MGDETFGRGGAPGRWSLWLFFEPGRHLLYHADQANENGISMNAERRGGTKKNLQRFAGMLNSN